MNPNTELQNFNCFMELTPIAEYPKQSADGAAATATPETPCGVVGSVDAVPIPVGLFVIHPAAAVTFNASNYASIVIAKRTAGGGAVTLATIDTHAVSWSAWTPISVAAAPGTTVAPGDAITITINKVGSGVVIPACYMALYPAVT